MDLSEEELAYLKDAFKDLLNYKSEDLFDPIDPLTYQAPDEDNCLHIAAFCGDYKAVSILLKAGLDVNALGDMGYTALHYAYMKKHSDIVTLLLENGASDEIISEFGTKPSDKI